MQGWDVVDGSAPRGRLQRPIGDLAVAEVSGAAATVDRTHVLVDGGVGTVTPGRRCATLKNVALSRST